MPPNPFSRQANAISRPLRAGHLQSSKPRHFSTTTCQQARLIKRPHRPYTFTQLLTLSDGSTFLHRTTSPLPVYKSTKDVRNTALWNPSNAKIANQEEDEAGRLRAFRRRFGRGWDAETSPQVLGAGEEVAGDAEGVELEGEMSERERRQGMEPSASEKLGKTTQTWSEEPEENLMDLINSYGRSQPKQTIGKETVKKQKKFGGY